MNCAREVAAAEAAKLSFTDRLVLNIQSLARTLVVVVVLVAVLGGLFFLFKDKFERPLTPEELARFRYAMTGSFESEEGVNLSSTVVGSAIIGATGSAADYPAKQVINEYTGEAIPAWRSVDASFPQEITVELSQRGAPEKITLQNHPDEPANTYPQEIEILVSVEGPTSGFVSVGRFTAERTTVLQRFTFPRTIARWVKLRIDSNYGSSSYTSLDEFGTYNVPDSPFGAPRLTPTAKP